MFAAAERHRDCQERNERQKGWCWKRKIVGNFELGVGRGGAAVANAVTARVLAIGMARRIGLVRGHMAAGRLLPLNRVVSRACVRAGASNLSENKGRGEQHCEYTETQSTTVHRQKN